MVKRLFSIFFISLGISLGSPVKVVDVYDGDTFVIESGEAVRLLGIDTPEIGEPGADIAKDFLEKLVLGKEVRLERDSVDKDDHNRLLRYVYVGDLFVNAELIRKGYAEVKFYPPNLRYKEEFEELEKTASRLKKGLWAFSVFQPPEIKKVPSQIIPWEKADEYYGKIITVEGEIVRTNRTKKVCYLNFHKDWKRYLTLVIFTADLDKFPPYPEDYYLYKRVRVRGLVKEYKGRPEIILKDPKQIEIIESSSIPKIVWEEADRYYGKRVIVEGKVVGTYRKDKVCFLNLNKDWRRYGSLVIFAKDLDKFPQHPEDYYLNKRVRVTGVVKEYKGRPEIILKDPKQIEVVGE